MWDLSKHPLFEAYEDPQSGVISWRLKNTIAPLQRHFYYVNPSVRGDDRWLWVCCAHPPNPQMYLAAVSLDPDDPKVIEFPQAGFSQASPMVTEAGDAVYFAQGSDVWHLNLAGELTHIAQLPDDYRAGRHLFRLVTHLSMSADGKYLLLDGCAGLENFIALAEIATGEVKVLREFVQRHDHAQFSPLDPELFMIAHDQTLNPITGRFIHHAHRIHLMNVTDTRYECMTPKEYCKPYVGDCHEWWLSDGRIGYINYERGLYVMDNATADAELIWPEPLCHGHSHPSQWLFVADQDPYTWDKTPCEVRFFNPQSNKVIKVDSGMPIPSKLDKNYHIHPHPQFSSSGDWVIYTTTQLGAVSIALVDTNQLEEASL